MLQVARIVSAEPLENSAKLLRLQADLGGGDTRQVMAGGLHFGQHTRIYCCTQHLLFKINSGTGTLSNRLAVTASSKAAGHG